MSRAEVEADISATLGLVPSFFDSIPDDVIGAVAILQKRHIADQPDRLDTTFGPGLATIRPEITFSRPRCGHFFFLICCPRSRQPSRPRSGSAGRRTGKGRCDCTGVPGVGKP